MGGQRRAVNIDGTFFTLEQFIKVADANITTVEELKTLTEDMEKQSMEGVDEDFLEGPPCLALISKISRSG